MGRIAGVFEGRRSPALICFAVGGDPDFAASLRIAKTLVRAGADILELGVPFSDPVADGPTIQRADERALAAGTTPDTVFAVVRGLRQESDVPVVLLAYFNTVFKRGIAQFYRDARAAGVDGVLIADLPVEESGEVLEAAKTTGLDQILLVARTTSDERLQRIAAHAGGFLYLVSVLGVTGARDRVPEEAFDLVRRVKAVTGIPVALGFGISGPDQVQACAAHGADGVIVGSAIVDIIGRTKDNPETMERELSGFVSRMKQAAGGSRHG
jgi:tryptophan synthase alpha chain